MHRGEISDHNKITLVHIQPYYTTQRKNLESDGFIHFTNSEFSGLRRAPSPIRKVSALFGHGDATKNPRSKIIIVGVLSRGTQNCELSRSDVTSTQIY